MICPLSLNQACVKSWIPVLWEVTGSAITHGSYLLGQPVLSQSSCKQGVLRVVQGITYWLDRCEETQAEQQADLMCEFCGMDVGDGQQKCSLGTPWLPLYLRRVSCVQFHGKRNGCGLS